MRDSQDRQMGYRCHPDLRRRGWVLGHEREGKQFIGRWKGVNGKQMFIIPTSYYNILIYDGSSFLRAGLVSISL